jgi:hypothetical protein
MRNITLIMIGLVIGFPFTAFAEDAAVPVAVAASTSVPSAASLPGVTPTAPALRAPRQDLNEMKGIFQSKGDDPPTLRILVDGGFNVEFTYDRNTSLVNGGNPIHIEDLNYGDEIIVRYAGKDLNAIDIDRVSKAPRPH